MSPAATHRPGAAWYALVLALLALVGFGVYGYAQQRLHGDVVTGLRTIGEGGAGWGLYIVFDIVLAGLAFAGLAVASVSRMFRVRQLRPFARMALLMAFLSLCMAGLCVLADLGRPLHGLLYLPRYARPASPFFGTFTMIVCGGLVASLVMLYLGSRADAALLARRGGPLRRLYGLWAAGYKDTPAERNRHRVQSRLTAAVVFPLMVAAYSTLGFVFGIQGGRPGWFSAVQAPSFVVLAALSGTGLLLFIAGVVRAARGDDALPESGFRWLGNALLVLISVHLYIVAVQELTTSYAAGAAESRVARAVDTGAYAPLFYGACAIFLVALVVLGLQFMRGRTSIGLTAAVGLCVNVAAVLARYLVVVPSQTHGMLLPFPTGRYVPTWVEVAVVAGLLALGTLAYLIAARLLPLVPLQPMGEPEMPVVAVRRPRRRAARLLFFGLTLAAGLALAGAGLLLSARFWTEPPYQDPRVPFAPVLFIAGLVLGLGSAVVYELIPRSLPAEQTSGEAPVAPVARGGARPA